MPRTLLIRIVVAIILCIFIDTVLSIQSHNFLSLPNVYSGSTPYKGVPFGSENVTIPLRTQRDIALNVTIDRHLWPALNMGRSFFRSDYSAQRLSEVELVMRMGYRRLVLDIFWDASRRNWQLCPENVPATSLQQASTQNLDIGSVKCAPWYTFRHFMDSVNHYLTSTDLATSPADTDLLFLVLNLYQLNGTSNDNSTNISISNHNITSTATNNNETASSLRDTILSAIVNAENNAPRIYAPRNLTTTAWPSWFYLIRQRVQLLVGVGDNNLPSDTNYNLTNDADILFNETQLGAWLVNATNACVDHNNTAVTALSWAYAQQDNDTFDYNTVLSAVQCGYSPYFVAYSESNDLADRILATLWSWDVHEPRVNLNNEVPRCAMVQQWNGRWRAGDCTQLLRAACRHKDNPDKVILLTNFLG